MNKYIIKFSGAVEVEADSKEGAIDRAWVDEKILFDDIDSVVKVKR